MERFSLGIVNKSMFSFHVSVLSQSPVYHLKLMFTGFKLTFKSLKPGFKFDLNLAYATLRLKLNVGLSSH